MVSISGFLLYFHPISQDHGFDSLMTNERVILGSVEDHRFDSFMTNERVAKRKIKMISCNMASASIHRAGILLYSPCGLERKLMDSRMTETDVHGLIAEQMNFVEELLTALD